MGISKRYHDFDALRAFAMLLGILLHATMSMIEWPPGVWPVQDIQENSAVYGSVLHSLHGFRLPLFFMMSGFFTAMLLGKRGLRQLMVHRAKRILLPLTLGWLAVWPALIGVGMLAPNNTFNVWEAAGSGEVERLREYLEAGGDVEARFDAPGIPGSGATPLHIAAVAGQDDVVKLLLEQGADVNSVAHDRSGGTPLHWAASAGQLQCVRTLVAAGADVNAENGNGYTPHDLARAAAFQPAATTAGSHDREFASASAADARRQDPGQDGTAARITSYLASHGATPRDMTVASEPPLSQPVGALLVLLGCFAPFFAHLWFLWHLCWLILAFVLVVWLARRLRWKRFPARLVRPPHCLFWLLPLTLVAQMGMVQTFGPDTSAGIVPWPPVLAYYAIFFGFGALVYGNPEAEQRLGGRWQWWLLLGLTSLPIGIWLFETRPGGDMLTIIDFSSSPVAVLRSDLDLRRHALTSLLAVVYCWSMVFACIGVFRRYFSSENRRIRYLSDSAYWLYLAHLPLIQLLQVLVWDWPIPGTVKVAFVSIATFAILLIAYEYCVRYTWIGTMLNGKRTRPGRVERSAWPSAYGRRDLQ